MRASDLRDDVLPEDLGDLVVALLPVVTSHEAALVAWFVVDSEGALPSVISDGQIGNESQGMVFYRFCAPDSLSAQLKATWASHLGVRLFPSDSLIAGVEALREQESDTSDDQDLGLAFEPSKNTALSLVRSGLHIARFALRLGSSAYRQRLLNPFEHAHWRLPTRRLGAYLEKGGHDDVATLEFMTTLPPDEAGLRRVLESGGRRVTIES